MDSIITFLLQLDGSEIEAILNMFITLSILGVYFIPVAFLANDILNRYQNRYIAFGLIILAVFTLPVFVFTYLLFRKSSTAKDDNYFQKDLQMAMISSKSVECPKCKNISYNNHKFCNNCGLFLRPECKGCNFPVALDWKYCVNCGKANQVFEQRKAIRDIKATKLTSALVDKVAYFNN